MSEAENDQKIAKYGTLKKMFARFADLVPREPAPKPEEALVFDAVSGRYTNESIAEWMDGYADGLVYGIRFPNYAYSPSTTAEKTDANEGLVIEPSSNTVAGQNDYKGKKLFMCPRVNGGVDADGMPYVTAIEGIDDRFNASSANTWALTPVYYVKRTGTDMHTLNQFSDSPLDGFEECPKARVPDGRQRPYILRACYMDSGGDFSSKSGTLPASATNSSLEGYWPHSLQNDFGQARIREDGLSYLSYADVTYQMDFMQLMLGVKAPKSQATGNTGSAGSWQIISEGAGKTVTVQSTQSLFPGFYVNLGTSYDHTNYPQCCSKAHAVRIAKVEQTEEGTAVTLDLDENAAWSVGDYLTACHYFNGSCDNIRGTYGCFDLAHLTTSDAPFRFQNVEWGLGMHEICTDVYNRGGAICVAHDVQSCDGVDGQTGWTDVWDDGLAAGFIGDLSVVGGVLLPTYNYGSSTTGYMVSYAANSFNSAAPFLIGGRNNSASDFGVGSLNANESVAGSFSSFGTRASALGRAEA